MTGTRYSRRSIGPRETFRRQRTGYRVWIILPAFNEAENLPALLEGIAGIDLPPCGYAVLVVDDGSGDATAAVASSYAGKLPLKVISHATNLGLARTIATGIGAVIGGVGQDDVVITMDADNTHSPSLIPCMLRQIEQGADLVIASRYVAGGKEHGVPLLRRILSHGLGILMRLRYGLRGVRDYSCGYRAYRAQLLQIAVHAYGDRLIQAEGFAVMAEILVKMSSFSPRVVEVPLLLRYDLKRGSSKIRVLRTMAEYLRLLFTQPRSPRDSRRFDAPAYDARNRQAVG